MSDKVKGVVVKAGAAIGPAKPPVKSTAVKPAAKSEKEAPAKVETPVDQTEVDVNDEDIVSKVSSECPAFLTGWNPKEADCMTCATDFPVEYAECEKVCTADKAASPKGKIKAAGKKKGENTTNRQSTKPKSRYGHYQGTMNIWIDDMLWDGTTMDALKAVLMKKFGRDERLAAAKIVGHIKYLKTTRGIDVVETEGKLKATQEFMTGCTAENTVKATDVVAPAPKAKAEKK